MADAKVFNLVVSKVDEVLYEGEVSSVTVPGTDGEMTILANHVALISTLKKGVVKIQLVNIGGSKQIEIEKGILEFSNNNATVLL